MRATLVRFLIVFTLLFASGSTSSLAQYVPDVGGSGAGPDPTTMTTVAPPQGGYAKAISIVFTEYMRFLNDAVSNIFAALQGSFAGFASVIVTVYIVFVSFGMFFGRISKDFWVSCFLVAGLSALVFSPGQYQSWVFDPFVGTVTDLSNFFVSKGAGVPINAEGDILNYMGTTLNDIWEITDKMERNLSLLDRTVNIWLAFKVGVAQAVLLGSYVACIAGYMYLILQAWFAIYMYMIIGGICLFFAAFKGTRFLAVAWFRSLCHEGLTIIFASLIMGISGNMIQKLMKILTDTDVGVTGIFTPQYFAVLLASIMGFLMLLKAPQLAASISGGSAGSTSGVTAAVGSIAGMGVGLVKSRWNSRGGGGNGGGSGVSGGQGASGAQSAAQGAQGAYSRMKGTSTGMKG